MLVIGQTYEVPCAQIRMDLDGQVMFVPILNHLHSDPQFGFPDEHYHIDGRFELHPRLKHRFNVNDGHTSTVIVANGTGTYRFEGIVTQKLKCERHFTGITIPDDDTKESVKNYWSWYESFVGKECKGKKCPHFGTEMLEQDGKLVCPMHKLTADATTLKILPSYTVI